MEVANNGNTGGPSPSNNLSQVQKQPNQIKPLLTIIHFNDVYDIQPKNGSKGVCNFKAKIEALRIQFPKAITLFSGDCLSPSALTNIKEGWQMVHALNTIGIDCACYGNHEFDFSIQHTLRLVKSFNFQWLLGNITYKSTNKLLGDGLPYIVKQHQGLRIGIMGVAGSDWIGILNDQYENLLKYENAQQFAIKTAKYLRDTLKCDLVIALTHMRNAADRQFPLRVQNVDLVLGGHDHVVMQQFINETLVIKSGTNFNNVGLIHLYPKTHPTPYSGKRVNYQWNIFKIADTINVDVQLKKYVDQLMEQYQKYDQVVGYTTVPLEARFIKIRKEESNYGNFFADLARQYYDCDAVAINSGMIRNDIVLGPGKLTFSKVSNIIDSPMIVKKVKGRAIQEMLELSVSQYPNYSGQFLFVSGLRYSFDHRLSPRVQEITVGGYLLDLQQEYTLCTTDFQARGGDSFTMLKDGEQIIDKITGTSMLQLLLKFFKAADTHQEYKSIKILAQLTGSKNIQLQRSQSKAASLQNQNYRPIPSQISQSQLRQLPKETAHQNLQEQSHHKLKEQNLYKSKSQTPHTPLQLPNNPKNIPEEPSKMQKQQEKRPPQQSSIKQIQTFRKGQQNYSVENQQPLQQFPQDHLILVRKVSVKMGRIKNLRSGFKLNDDGRKLTTIRPIVDGRVRSLYPI